jgi:hypothetical protein
MLARIGLGIYNEAVVSTLGCVVPTNTSRAYSRRAAAREVKFQAAATEPPLVLQSHGDFLDSIRDDV